MGTAALGRLLGPLAPILTRGGKVAVKDVIKPTVSRLLKEFPRTLAIEGGTEFGQQFGQALVEKGAGIRPEAEPVMEGLGTLGPTAVLTGLTMGMAIPSQRLRARSVEKSLEDEKSAPEARRAAADHVAAYMAEADEEFARKMENQGRPGHLPGAKKFPLTRTSTNGSANRYSRNRPSRTRARPTIFSPKNRQKKLENSKVPLPKGIMRGSCPDCRPFPEP